MNLKALSLVAATVTALGAAAPANAVVTVFSATLSGAGEVPPVSTTASGLALITFNDAAFTVTVNEIFIGLIGGPATAGHIHCCTATAGAGTAPVVVPFTGFPTSTFGSYNNTFTLASGAFSTLLTGSLAGKAYVNIHNATYPSGEIQGFLQLVPVPEPGTYALMAAGLAAVGWVARKRKAA